MIFCVVEEWQSGPKGEKVTGEWRKIHNEELHHDLNSSPTCAGDKINMR
jgi:hypothetical protein